MREVRIKLVTREPIVDYSISKPSDAITLMKTIIGDMADEYFAAVFLNTKNEPLDFIIAGIGSPDQSRIVPSTVLKGALLQNSTKVMLFHNHPTGDVKPSNSDLASTQRFVVAARLMDIEILDHVIVSDKKHFSFAEHELMDVTDLEYIQALKELNNMSVEKKKKKYSLKAADTYYQDVEVDNAIKQE